MIFSTCRTQNLCIHAKLSRVLLTSEVDHMVTMNCLRIPSPVEGLGVPDMDYVTLNGAGYSIVSLVAEWGLVPVGSYW